MGNIKSTFNDIAGIYDNQRRKLIPCFDDFYNSAVSVIQLDLKSPRVLDIGAGTGLFSSFLQCCLAEKIFPEKEKPRGVPGL